MNAGLDIILLLALVIFLINRLKNVLGETPDGENNDAKKGVNPPPLPDNVINMIIQDVEEEKKQESLSLSPVDEVFRKISNYKKVSFTAEFFLEGAKKAFELIVLAFAKGDLVALKMLVDDRVFKNFEKVIEERKEKEQEVECQFIGFVDVEVTDAVLEEFEAKITVKFVSEQVNILKDKDGNVIEGDEKFVETVTDLWSFTKDIRDDSPAWTLVSTKSVE
jgi:predicted lipid-binding transport protein (Tim44 family)